jgi:hypothetical protein
MATDPGHRQAVHVEAEEEEGDAGALLEVLEVELSLEAEIAVTTLCFVQVEAPQVGALMGVVALETHT